MKTQKVALVTGASAGMGKDIALQLLKDGFVVYAAARRIEQMSDIAAQGGITLKMDITQEDDIVAVVQQIVQNHNGVDVLINNAGFGMYGAIEDTTISDARYQFEVNIFGLASLTQKILPYMRSKKAGTVINISSVGGKIYTPLGAWYHATKHALEGWSDCLRLEVSQFGINVVIIEPGIITTEFGDVMSGPMLKRSGNTAYGSLAQKIAVATARNYAQGQGSPSTVISVLVSKILKTNGPKTRYSIGKLAKPVLFARWLFSDRFFDKIIMSQVK